MRDSETAAKDDRTAAAIGRGQEAAACGNAAREVGVGLEDTGSDESGSAIGSEPEPRLGGTSGPVVAEGMGTVADRAMTAAGESGRVAGGRARTTVVIATRNRAPELARTLTELRTLRPCPEIMVLDNASDDDTAAVAAAFPGVTVIRLPRNLGAAARNLGVEKAHTPYVAFSDDDSWWAGEALTRAEKLFDACPRLGLVAGRTLVGAADRDDPVNELMANSPLGPSADLPGPSILGFLACAAIVRKEAYLGVGGFSPLLHFGAEEKLLALDLAASGWQLCYVADIRAHHHPSAQRPPSQWRRRAEQRNNALITWMRRPLRRCAAETARLLARAVREPRTAPVVAGVLRRLPWALAQRRRLPPEVERGAATLELAEERK
ncbi:glycosyltransferase family 2 protein [Nocardia carnea]|uniref:Glycosyltransferase family 2 protein n=1 Tax=Nocardia carnea TaxID=37328 RepID=A0ABW7TH79_9NOCA|nr:glycosyltransferase [Nocardia carnea]